MTRIVHFCSVLILFVASVAGVSAADIFRFYAPPGGAYANAAFERDATVEVQVSIEHEGVAIPSWFLAVSRGGSTVYEPRELTAGADVLDYQIYGETPPSVKVLKEPPAILTADNVITSADFNTLVVTAETVSFSMFVYVPTAQFQPAGEYTDTVTLSLYTGDYATPASHVLEDSVSLAVTGRLAELIDIYSDREPGIRYMDLTATETGRLIATINERSNSSTGYTVSLTSANLAADLGGATEPYFAHTSAAGSLEYTLTYGGSAVAGWSSGTSVITDSVGTTAPEWLSKELRISYVGSAALPAGDYEDIVTLTISSK
jgi:spore coat protein U-like protein